MGRNAKLTRMKSYSQVKKLAKGEGSQGATSSTPGVKANLKLKKTIEKKNTKLKKVVEKAVKKMEKEKEKEMDTTSQDAL